MACRDSPLLHEEFTIEDVAEESEELAETEVYTYLGIGESMKLGDTISNPHSISIMREAFANLSKQNSVGHRGGSSITDTTHVYIRFLPKSEAEVELLKADTTVELFGYPLLRELEEGRHIYHDPSVPKEEITWQYTVWSVDKSIPNVEFEVLSYLHMGPNDENEEEFIGSYGNVSWTDLEDRAIKLADQGIGENQLDGVAANVAVAKYYPRGVNKSRGSSFRRAIDKQ